MNIVLLSEFGRTAGLASRLSKEGHTVNFIVPEPGPFFFKHHYAHNPDLLVQTCVNLSPDVVIVDSAGLGRIAERVRKAGRRVIGSSQWAVTVLEDKAYLRSVLSSIGVPVDAPSDGVNLYVSGWFNGACFISSYVSLLYRRLMAGGRGPDTGRVGSFSYHRALTAKTFKQILQPMEAVLRRVNHRGIVHIHAKVSQSDYAITELNTNLDHPLALTTTECLPSTVTDWITRIMNEASSPCQTKTTYTTTAFLTTAFVDGEMELPGVCAGNIKHICPINIVQKDGKYVACGPELGYVTAKGDNLPEAVRRMYRTLGNISTPDCMYRNDIGRGVQGLLDSLEKWGWIN